MRNRLTNEQDLSGHDTIQRGITGHKTISLSLSNEQNLVAMPSSSGCSMIGQDAIVIPVIEHHQGEGHMTIYGYTT